MIIFLHFFLTECINIIIMVKAWFMDSSDEDQRLPHQLDPPEPVSLEDLKNCGVLYWKVKYTFQFQAWEKKLIIKIVLRFEKERTYAQFIDRTSQLQKCSILLVYIRKVCNYLICTQRSILEVQHFWSPKEYTSSILYVKYTKCTSTILK